MKNNIVFDLTSFINQLYDRLPNARQTEAAYQLIWNYVMNGVITQMTDYMSREDFERLFKNPRINDDNVQEALGSYIENHPALQSHLKEELDIIEKNVLKLYTR